MSRRSRRDYDWDSEGEFDDAEDGPDGPVQTDSPEEAKPPRVDPWWVRDDDESTNDLGDPARTFDADQPDQSPPEFHEFEIVEPTGKSQRRVVAGVLAAVALVGIGLVGVLSKRSSIERDLRTHVEANYDQAGLGGLKVTANGRDLTATGVVGSEDELKRAQDLARTVRGVRRITLRVTVQSTVAKVAPSAPVSSVGVETAPTTTLVAISLPDVSLIVEGKKLTVIGSTPNAEARKAFLTSVSSATSFGPKNVKSSDLVTVEGSKGALQTWQRLGLLTAGVPQAKITNLAITIVDDVMTLTGVVDDPTIHDRLLNAAQQVAGDPSHVIDQTSGANRTPTTAVTEASIPAASTTVVVAPSEPVVSATTPSTPATTASSPVAPVGSAPAAVIAAPASPGVTTAARAPRPARTAVRTGRSSASSAAATRRAASSTGAARATVTAPKVTKVAIVATTKPSGVGGAGVVNAGKAGAATSGDGFVAAGSADVTDTTSVEEPPVAVPDVESDAPSVSTRDQVRAAIAGASVDFSEGSTDLSDSGKAVVGRVAKVLADSTVRVEVRAYTDDRGDDQVNRALTQRRANVVRAELIAQGVDGSRVSASGLGAASPVASDDTPAGRRANRRVVFALFGS